MKYQGFLYAVTAAVLLAMALPATAERGMPFHGLSEDERQEVRERWSDMSPEERAEVRRQADEYWAGLSEEERAEKREELREYHQRGARSRAHGDWTSEEREAHVREMRERWEAMSPEEQQAYRERMRERRADGPPPHARAYGRDKDHSGKAKGREKKADDEKRGERRRPYGGSGY